MIAVHSYYVYVGDFGAYRAPGWVVAAALEDCGLPRKKLDGRTRFAKALETWGRWMDYCERVKT